MKQPEPCPLRLYDCSPPHHIAAYETLGLNKGDCPRLTAATYCTCLATSNERALQEALLVGFVVHTVPMASAPGRAGQPFRGGDKAA